MKWGCKRGSRTRSQNGCRMFVGLVLVVLLVLSGGRLPVARADVYTYGASAILPITKIQGAVVSASYMFYVGGAEGTKGGTGSFDTTILSGGGMAVDGVSVSGWQLGYSSDWQVPFPPYYTGNYFANGVGFNTTDARVLAMVGDGQQHVMSWSGGTFKVEGASTGSGSFSGGSVTTRFINNGLSWVDPGVFNASEIEALSVSITGPSTVVVGVGGDWSASGAGGVAPYTYGWAYGATGPWGSYPYGGSTLSHNFATGSWALGVQVTDSMGTHALDSIAVESGSDIVGYRIELARSGTYGQYITVIVYDHAGVVSPIAHTVGTECGYDFQGAFGWYANVSEAAWVNLYWRWTLGTSVAAIPPPAEFWFRSSVHLTNGTELAVTSQFSSWAGIATLYDDDTGDPINPDVPPEAESTLPAWLQSLMDKLKAILQWVWEKIVAPALQALFVPSDEQIDQLMPTGSFGASLLEGTSWAAGDSSWSMHTHWGTNEIVLVNVDFSDLGAFGTAVKLIVQAGICLSLIYMVVVLL